MKQEEHFYDLYGARIFAVGIVTDISLQPNGSEEHWGRISGIQILDNPLLMHDIRELIQINRFGSITYLNQQKAELIYSLLENEGNQLPLFLNVSISEETREIVQKQLSQIAQTLSDKQLEQAAYSHSRKGAKSYTSQSHSFMRNPYIAEYAKRRANGKCELCGNMAPFCDKNGTPYLEAHHIVWLSRGGDDSVENTVALCANCHRKMHILENEKDVRYLMSLYKDYTTSLR